MEIQTRQPWPHCGDSCLIQEDRKKVKKKRAFQSRVCYYSKMTDEIMRYRGRVITQHDIEFLRSLIENNPGPKRQELSRKVCEAWGWRQANGGLKDIVCRGMMLKLHRAGHIQLPPSQIKRVGRRGQRKKPSTDILLDQTEKTGALSELQPLEIRQVRRTESEAIFNGLIEKYHYPGYVHPVGEHLKYMVYSEGCPIACMAWSSAPWHIGARDRYIGWTPEIRKKNLHYLAYNTRYLILPWIKVKHLASHILSQISRRIVGDWQELYAHPVYYLETFIDTELFKGTSYRAANWVYPGKTTGRGIKDKKHKVTLSKNDVPGYPLRRDFRRRLCEVSDEEA